jgi:hypothetical protein
MLCYKDGRFSKHSRFRFATFNTLLRQQTANQAGFWVNKSAYSADLTTDDIQDALTEDTTSELLNSIFSMSKSLKGSQSFWKFEGKKLEAMVRFL